MLRHTKSAFRCFATEFDQIKHALTGWLGKSGAAVYFASLWVRNVNTDTHGPFAGGAPTGCATWSMVIAAVPALAFNARHKLRAGIVGRHTSPSHQYWEANIAFYATAGVTVLLLHSWVSILAPGLESVTTRGSSSGRWWTRCCR